MDSKGGQNNQAKKVFDVRRPGKTPAAATSRPVITMHKPSIKDQDVSLGFGSERRKLMDSKHKIKVKPDTAAEPQPEAELEAPAQTQAPSAPPLPAQEETKEPELPTKAPEDQNAATAQQQSAAPAPAGSQNRSEVPAMPQPEVEAPVKDVSQETAASSPTSGSDEPQKAPPEKSEPLHMDMPESFKPGAVVVSHHGKARTIWLEILAVLVILLLLAAISNFLLDAEIIKTDLNLPHTDFFD